MFKDVFGAEFIWKSLCNSMRLNLIKVLPIFVAAGTVASAPSFRASNHGTIEQQISLTSDTDYSIIPRDSAVVGIDLTIGYG